MVFKAPILDSLGGSSANVGSSANFCVPVFKASMLYYFGGPLAKEGSSAKYEHTSKFTLASQNSIRITYEIPIKLLWFNNMKW